MNTVENVDNVFLVNHVVVLNVLLEIGLHCGTVAHLTIDRFVQAVVSGLSKRTTIRHFSTGQCFAGTGNLR